MSVCLLYVLAWQLPESKSEQHVKVTVTHVGKAGWHTDGGKQMLVQGPSRGCSVLLVKAEAQRDGVSASNAVSAFGLPELHQDACSKQGEKASCKKLHLPIILHFW